MYFKRQRSRQSYQRNHEREPAIVHRPLITAIRDAPDFLAASGTGPSPLLQRSSSQQESHTTSFICSSGSVQLFEQSPSLAHCRLKSLTSLLS